MISSHFWRVTLSLRVFELEYFPESLTGACQSSFRLYFLGCFRTRFPSNHVIGSCVQRQFSTAEKTSRKASEELGKVCFSLSKLSCDPLRWIGRLFDYEKWSIGSDQLNLSQDSSWSCFRAQTQLISSRPPLPLPTKIQKITFAWAAFPWRSLRSQTLPKSEFWGENPVFVLNLMVFFVVSTFWWFGMSWDTILKTF